MNTASLNRQLPAGNVGFISQSGGLVNAVAHNPGPLDFGDAFSSGDEEAVDCSTLLGYLVDDEFTDISPCFLEAIRWPQPFFGRS